ncbi:MAG TPA: MmcQ/YjbR family DNA-binding protein, partial [Candidatus Dormibacteraeota bacterium]|nr:MmcQ/YjbR family DNA-binding protein [Candidatus Dormibacteraeota bacterium]
MTPQGFRKLALGLPEAYEASHMGHADFRVGKRVFATLGYPDAAFGMVKLTPAQQAHVIRAAPRVFAPVKGKWGTGGATQVRLGSATPRSLAMAMKSAWSNVASKS